MRLFFINIIEEIGNSFEFDKELQDSVDQMQMPLVKEDIYKLFDDEDGDVVKKIFDKMNLETMYEEDLLKIGVDQSLIEKKSDQAKEEISKESEEKIKKKSGEGESGEGESGEGKSSEALKDDQKEAQKLTEKTKLNEGLEQFGLFKDRQEAREAGRVAAEQALKDGKSVQEAQQARKDAEKKVRDQQKKRQ